MGFQRLQECGKDLSIFFVSKGFYVIAPDQRGYSFGARPSFIKDYSIDKLINISLKFLKKLNINNFHFDWS